MSPNCRVSFASGLNYSNSSLVWSDESWSEYSSSSPHSADDSLNLVIRTARLDPGASTTFGWVYSFNGVSDNSSYPLSWMENTGSIRIQEPADAVAGTSVAVVVVVSTANIESYAQNISAVVTIIYEGVTVLSVEPVEFQYVDDDVLLFTAGFDSTTLKNGDGYLVSACRVLFSIFVPHV